MLSPLFKQFHMIMRLINYLFVFIVVTGFISGCSTTKNLTRLVTSDSRTAAPANGTVVGAAAKAYKSASKQMQKGNFQMALEEYNEIILKYPFGAITEQAKLDRIFVYDRLQEPQTAVSAADSFIAQYPSHENIDYAYYMKGVAVFEKRAGYFEKRANVESSKNKQSLIKSKAAFKELVQRFPGSQYVKDAQQRIIYLNNKIAEQELSTARFYAKRNAHIAAINRGKYIVENYSKSPAAYDALILLRDTYKEMGLIDAARDTQAVINLNSNPTLKSNKQNLKVKSRKASTVISNNKSNQRETQHPAIKQKPLPKKAVVKIGDNTNKKTAEKKGSFWPKLPKLPKIFKSSNN